ncbi:MAG TPA: polyphenol oxidase family protein [Candidatus Babeliales bacterium]|nr:polyphenol oxidase family protein [Candidatus Babeliales bacterium]
MERVVTKDIAGEIRVGYSGMTLGNVNPAFGGDAQVNFNEFLAIFPGKRVYDMPAVGKDNILDIDTLTPEQLSQRTCDAMVTRRALTLLVLKAADCPPVVFWSRTGPELALAHVGTAGAAMHLPRKVIEFLGLKPSDLNMYIGPSISKQSYRFDKDISDKGLDSSWDDYVSRESDWTHIDTLGYIVDEAKSCGINSIEVEGVDTGASDSGFFSHRRHRLTGEPNGRNCFAVCRL